MVKNICSALRKAFKAVISYWNRNATKRWLLALDRLSICFMWLVIGGVLLEKLNPDDWYIAIYGSCFLLFFLLYTPSYMFPGSNEELKPSDKKTKE